MANGTSAGLPAEVTWRQLRRVNVHRTSQPTNDTVRKTVGLIQSERGKAPSVDAVILAALRLATTGDNLARLMEIVREVEIGTYPGPHSPIEPGE